MKHRELTHLDLVCDAISVIIHVLADEFHGLETEGGRRHPQGDDLTLLVTAGGAELPEQVFLYYEFIGGESGEGQSGEGQSGEGGRPQS